MKHIYAIFAIFLFLNSYAQNGNVGFGTDTPHPSAALDITSDNKGILPPHIALLSKTDAKTIPNPTEGTLIYNTSNISGNADTAIGPGLVYWQNNSWQPAKVSTSVELTQNGRLISYLGFNTEPFTPDLGTDFNNNGFIFKLDKCIKWDTNNHTYCAFTADKGMNWQQAFNIAKERKGYLATITDLDEWNYLYDNIIINLPNSFWIGYNKIDFSGNPTEFAWITGEKQKINWPTLTTEDYFRAGEPNNAGGNEGCVHVVSKQVGDGENKRGWNDLPCSSATEWTGIPMRHIIIEYNP